MESILHEMKLAVDHTNVPVFEPDIVEKIAKRAVDGCLGLFLVRPLTNQKETKTSSAFCEQ